MSTNNKCFYYHMMDLYKRINSSRHNYIPKTPKFVGATQDKRSWENIFVDVELELAETVEDWLKSDFKNYFRKWSATTYNVIVVQTDEDDVTFGYIQMQKLILPYIAKYISTSDNGSKYRLFFFSELKPSEFNPDTYDYEGEINSLIEKGTW